VEATTGTSSIPRSGSTVSVRALASSSHHERLDSPLCSNVQTATICLMLLFFPLVLLSHVCSYIFLTGSTSLPRRRQGAEGLLIRFVLPVISPSCLKLTFLVAIEYRIRSKTGAYEWFRTDGQRSSSLLCLGNCADFSSFFQVESLETLPATRQDSFRASPIYTRRFSCVSSFEPSRLYLIDTLNLE
jgi:hypothetical protein